MLKNSGILQRENRRPLNEMTGCGGHRRRIDFHDTRTERDQDERCEQSRCQAGNRAGGVEAFPEKREHDDRQVGRGCDGKGERDEERDVGVFA